MKRLTRGIIFLAITFVLSSAAWAKGDVHTITSESFSLLLDGTTGVYYYPGQITGTLTISWKEDHRYGFLNAKLYAGKDQFEFRLVSISNCDDHKMEGLFDIYKNGELRAEGVVGKVEDLSGICIQFTAGTSQCNDSGAPIWEFRFSVDYRVDF